MHARLLQISLGLTIFLCGSVFGAPSHGETATRALTLIDVILEHHVDPPTRHEMILGGARELFRAAQMPQPLGLSQRISRLDDPEQFRALLTDILQETATTNNLEDTLLHGITGVVSGHILLTSEKQFKVEQQLAANRYVGIGIVLTFDKNSGFPRINETFARGSAHRAGVRDGDFITSIEGTDAHQMSIKEAVDRLRGDEGTSVTIIVRQPKEKESRKLVIPRTVVPRQTVRGYELRGKEDWIYRVKQTAPIAYLRITEFGSSTVHELRLLERELKAAGFRALMLDLQNYQNSRLTEAALVADAFLDEGTIGQVRTSKGVRKFEADSDCLFRDWPMAVLITEFTAGGSEWLAAALQDRKRGVMIGRQTGGQGLVTSAVPLEDGGTVILTTGILKRGDGSSLLAPGPAGQGVRAGPPQPREERKNGVKPDHIVPSRQSNSEAALAGRAKIIDSPQNPDPKGLYRIDDPEQRPKEIDPMVGKALEILEEALVRQGASQQAANVAE